MVSAFRQHHARRGRRRIACASAACAASRRRRRSRSCCNTLSGYRNDVAFVLCGRDIERQGRAGARSDGRARSRRRPRTRFAGPWREPTMRIPTTRRRRARCCTARCETRIRASRAAASARAQSRSAWRAIPDFTSPRRRATRHRSASTTRAFVPAEAVEHVAVLDDGTRIAIPPRTRPASRQRIPTADAADAAAATGRRHHTSRRPLGTVAGARSGDKGGDANLGVWARNDASWRWLAHALTVDALRGCSPRRPHCRCRRHVLANLRALNFVIEGLLGEGVASSTRFDPQAKALGEWLRSRIVDIPEGTPMTDTELVHLDRRSAASRPITLDSPHNRNALSRQLVAELTDTPEHRGRRRRTSAPSCSPTPAPRSAPVPTSPRRRSGPMTGTAIDAAGPASARSSTVPKPVIASIDGNVRAGGVGLIGACDIVVAGPRCTFAITEARLGLAAAVISVSAPPPSRRACRRALLPHRRDVRRRRGAAHRPGDHRTRRRRRGDRRRSPPTCSRRRRRGSSNPNASPTGLIRAAIERHGDEMVELSARLFASEEAHEGMTAFLERRPPRWTA